MTNGLARLDSCGNDVKGAIIRFRGNESNYVRFLKKFLTDPTVEQMNYCLEIKDYEQAENYISAISGVASNLGLTNLQNANNAIHRKIKQGSAEDMKGELIELRRVYDETVNLIEAL